MVAYLYRMPVGIAGAISRPQDLTTEPVILNAANTFSQYGLAGKDSADGKFIPLAASDAATVITGLPVRAPVPDHVDARHGATGWRKRQFHR